MSFVQGDRRQKFSLLFHLERGQIRLLAGPDADVDGMTPDLRAFGSGSDSAGR